MIIGGIETAKLPEKARIYFRRSVGKTLAESGNAMGYFYREKPYELPQYHEEALFACLCMACFWKEEERGQIAPLPKCLQMLVRGEKLNENSIHSKMLALLGHDWDAEYGNLLGIQLARLVKRVHTQGGTSPDFGQLYEDLTHWNSPNRWVQKRWAREYFTTQKFEEDESHAV